MSGEWATASAPTLGREEALRILAASADPELELLRRTLEQAAVRHPALPDAVRFAAIPRRFNREILALGPGAPGEGAGELLGLLAELPLTRRRQDGDFALEYGARRQLLEQWQETEESRRALAEHNRRLSAFHQARHEEVRRHQADLELAAPVLRSANRSRYLELQARVDALEIEPLLEALYHESQLSPTQGYDFFVRHVQVYERERRPSMCTVLLRALDDNLLRSTREERGNLPLWLEYWRARIANLQHSYAEAAELLAALRERAREAGDVKLLLWTLGDLGNALQGEDDLVGAGRVYQEELELAEASRADPYNLPTSYVRVAINLQRRDEVGRAAEAYHHAIRAAREQGNAPLLVWALLDLASVLATRGDTPAALASAVRALDLLRADPEHTPDSEEHLLTQLLPLVRDEPALLDTLHRAAAELLDPGSDIRPRLDLELVYVDALRGGGQVSRADALLAGVTEAAAGVADPRFPVALFLQQGNLREEQGRLDEAVEAYTLALGCLAGQERVGWDGAAALSNRGLAYRQQGKWEAALVDLRAARGHWERIGHTRLIAVVSLFQAEVYERRHRVAELQRRAPGDDGQAHCLLGELHRHHGRWEQADGEYARAAEAADPGVAARARLARARLAAVRCAWSEAAALAAHALESCARLADTEPPAPPAPAPEGGDLATARALLDEAEPHLGDDLPLWRGELLHLRGEILRDEGRLEAALAPLAAAAECYRRVREHRNESFVRADLADVALEAGFAAEARLHLEALAELWARLGRADAYRPTPQDEAADRQNAWGVRDLLTPGRERPDALRAARERFLAAGQLRPGRFWYALNRAYAALHLREWPESAACLEKALRLAPPWFPGRVLHERLARAHVRGGRELAEAGEAERALGHVERARALLGGDSAREAGDPATYADAWLELGEVLVQLGRLAAAEEWYTDCLGTLGPDAPRETAARLECRLALLAGRRGRLDEAVAHLARATQRAATLPDGAALVGDELARLAATAELFRCASEPLRVLAASLPEPPERRLAREALLRLSRSRYASAVLGAPAEEDPSSVTRTPLLVTPIAVEAATSLFPRDEGWTERHPLFQRYLPEMRERVAAEMGVVLPGIRVRAFDDLEDRGFRILLDETLLSTGSVFPGGCFSPDPAALPGSLPAGADELPRGLNPLTGEEDGAWIAAERAAPEREAGVPLWDVHEYLVRRLEAEIRSHLGAFVGVQELGGLVERWCAAAEGAEAQEARREQARQALPDAAARVRLVAVLQALLREAVSVAELGEILSVFRAMQGADPRDVAEEARFALREGIPAADVARTFLRLAPELEAELAAAILAHDGKRYLSLDPRWAQGFLAAAGEVLAGLEGRRASVVAERPEIRPFVRALLLGDHTHVGVVAARELGNAVDLSAAPVLSMVPSTMEMA